MFGLWGDEGTEHRRLRRGSIESAQSSAWPISSAQTSTTACAGWKRACLRLAPGVLTGADKPSRDAVRRWVGGLWQAMALASSASSDSAADERTQIIVEPFIGFIDLDKDATFTSRQRISKTGSIQAAAAIPRAILLLRKIANLRAARPRPSTSEPLRRAKVGRNEPCPCGSGKKFKRCCGQTYRTRPITCRPSPTLT